MERDALTDAFADVGVSSLTPDVASDLLSLAVHHGLSVTQLAQMWEAYATRLPAATAATVPRAQVQPFGAFVKKEAPAEEEEAVPAFARTPAFAPQSAAARTPAAAQPTPAAMPQATGGATAFSARGARMQSAPALNGHLPEVGAGPLDAPPRCEVVIEGPDEAAMGARYMRERLEDRADYIEGRLAEFAAAVAADSGAEAADALHAASGSGVRCVGRVVCEGDGRLNEASVLLEGSAAHSDGHRVRLELRDLPRFALFPGQAVVVEGANPSGFCLVARRLVAGAPGQREAVPPASAAPPLSLVVAAGPYTCGGDLAYEPLQELLSYCTERRPDALLLLGPFVDAEHAAVSGGALDVTFDALFEERVREALYAYLDAAGSGCRVVLLPSTRDAHAEPVFPQPALDASRFADAPQPGQLLSAPNPARLRVGPLQVAATSADVLKALSGAEAARGGAPNEDRLARLASHLVGQRSFFPLYPPPPGTMLDAKRATAGLALPCAPHLLLLPSDLAPFAKVLPGGPAVSEAPPQATEGGDATMEDAAQAAQAPAAAPADADAATVCINPGRLARGSLGGSFAHVHVAGGAGTPGAPVSTSVRVDIVRV